jgi:putative hemolysin
LLSVSTRLLNKLIGLKSEERPMTQEEIKMILHQSSEQGVIDKEETEMIRDVFRFSDKRANELMTHRRDLIILHPDDTQEKVMKTIEEEHYSKYLLVDERKDEIIGVVSVKDIILTMGNQKEFNLRWGQMPQLWDRFSGTRSKVETRKPANPMVAGIRRNCARYRISM